MKDDQKKSTSRRSKSAGTAPTALAAFTFIMQSTAAMAQQEVDLRTLQLLREEAMPDKDFYAFFNERNNAATRPIVTGNSYSRQSVTGGSYTRQTITGSSYTRQTITGSSYTRQSITDSSYTRQSITNGSYSRQSITGGNLVEPSSGQPVPGPIVSFEI